MFYKKYLKKIANKNRIIHWILLYPFIIWFIFPSFVLYFPLVFCLNIIKQTSDLMFFMQILFLHNNAFLSYNVYTKSNDSLVANFQSMCTFPQLSPKHLFTAGLIKLDPARFVRCLWWHVSSPLPLLHTTCWRNWVTWPIGYPTFWTDLIGSLNGHLFLYSSKLVVWSRGLMRLGVFPQGKVLHKVVLDPHHSVCSVWLQHWLRLGAC